MKIVDRKTFMALPDGIVASKFDGTFGAPFIKQETSQAVHGYSGDFYTTELLDSVDGILELDETGEAKVDHNTCGRDGLFEDDQHFAVWSPDDIQVWVTLLEKVVEVATKATEQLSVMVKGPAGTTFRLETQK